MGGVRRPKLLHALIQSGKKLARYPKLAGHRQNAPSPPSARLIAFNLKIIGNRRFFPFAAAG
jgi:hypothetical protein